MTVTTFRCPGCRRRVRVPAGTDPRRSRCSKCRTRLRPAAADAYHVFAAAAPVAPDPPADGPLSLDECEPIPAVGPATVELPPPAKVRARVGGGHPLRGRVTTVFTPFGLFAEREANRPLLFAPVGTVAVAAGRALRLALPDGPLALTLPSVQLAADAAAFLAGTRPVPELPPAAPMEWRKPLAVLLVVGLVAAAFVGGAAAYLALRPPPDAAKTPPSPPPGEPPSDLTELPPAPPGPTDPPTHYDLMTRDGTARLPDGPAAVTALAVTPDGAETVVGYADGSTWAWRLDQPAFEPPRVAPRGVGPVRRITFGPAGDVAYLACDGGLSVASFRAPRVTLHIPGAVAVLPEPARERFAALRADKLLVRYVPLGLATEPPPGRATAGVVTATPKDETIPANTRQDVPAPKATFAAWHPGGRLLYGTPDGAVNAYPTAVKATPATRLHKAPVRAWATGPTWPDFATGDDDGVVGVWPAGAGAPYPLRVSAVAVRGLAFSPCGGELAVADEAGAVAVWNLPTGTKVFEAFRPAVSVIAYGPRADVLLVSDAAGVQLWWLPPP